jgi:hypothetical protein
MNYKPEVLIYLNQIKSFLSKNEEASSYFMSSINPDIFYDELCKISEKNFDSLGEPNLTQEQFEELKKTIITKQTERKVFNPIETTKFGTYSLN